ncbi:MAG: glycerophosphodiester phosphodiesterase family protein, partial [Jatrophihabitantaceae bacterium]
MRYRDCPSPLAIAHRGGAGLAAENTLEAFRRSYALGLRYLETDVRLTSDGRLVAFHDAWLQRATGLSGRVRSRTLTELTATPVLGGGPVLALDTLLASFPDACFTVDVKDPATIAPLAEALIAPGAAARICVAGSRGSWLRALQAVVG